MPAFVKVLVLVLILRELRLKCLPDLTLAVGGNRGDENLIAHIEPDAPLADRGTRISYGLALQRDALRAQLIHTSWKVTPFGPPWTGFSQFSLPPMKFAGPCAPSMGP